MYVPACKYIPAAYFSPTSSPESPDGPHFSSLVPANDEARFIRSKSMNSVASNSAVVSSRIPRPPDLIKIAVKNDINSMTRKDSDSNLQMRILPKQIGNIGGVGSSSQDDDSLSGTESLDGEGRKKDKKKLKLISKLMRKTEA